ncbi:MAG: hypothetical protein AB7R87_24635 [Parvibaculaceae bacterium]
MADVIPIGIGYYTVPEASRLLSIPSINIRRWLGGYSFGKGAQKHHMDPLWQPQLPKVDGHMELGFRDLIELRFVQAFIEAGLNLFTIRNCLSYARQLVDDSHPFSTRRFQTDGKTIFLDSAEKADDTELLDLRKRQYVIKRVIERSFKDLDIDNDTVSRWRPFKGKSSIVIDPERAFGQPVAARYGVPTIVLSQAVVAEGSVSAVARLYEVSTAVVRDAVAYEKSLLAA